VNGAIAATLEARKAGRGRGGVFWQTQGSVKSFSMEKEQRGQVLFLACVK
jgi:type I site-specific restriction-modification system R (restriction) subunit